MSINVCWFEGIAGLDKYSAQFAAEGIQGRSRYACTGLLNEAFDSYGDLFQHFSGWEGMPRPLPEYAVVVIHGGHLRYQCETINSAVQELQGVLFIIIGDEEADFPEQQLRHRNMKIWRQSPIPGKSKADRYPLVGYPVDCREHLIHGQNRNLDWFFAGQVTNARRAECAAILRNMKGGLLLETKQFYSGIPHDEYFKNLGRAKVIPCPSGPVCSDTFRLAEALEAGCVPIIDEHPGWKDKPTTGFWNMIFPNGFPFPLIGHWSEAPKVIEKVLADYDRYASECKKFWQEYKANYFRWLMQDLKSLGVSVS